MQRMFVTYHIGDGRRPANRRRRRGERAFINLHLLYECQRRPGEAKKIDQSMWARPATLEDYVV